jgi:uncharacterized membrane protein
MLAVSSFAAWSQTAQPAKDLLGVRPADRISGQIDESQRAVLSGQRHPSAKAESAIGRVPHDQRMERMVLVLSASPDQEAALDELLSAQQDPESPYYHQWLTPQKFGQRFGVSNNDLEKVAGWLQTHGMEIEDIPASRRSIIFSGTAAQVESAFHTTMQKYLVTAQTHFANATDPEIPQALAGVVRGVVSLHDFRSAPAHVTAPAYTAGNGAHYLMPQDWVTIYDVGPLYNQGLDGTGQSIAVLGRVDISLPDVRTFRSNAGLPANDPQMIVNGTDPGFSNSNDQAESSLDVEWAGAIAKNVSVKFVTSKSGSSDGVALSAQYAVAHNVAPIISFSYGLCEAAEGSGGNAFWNSLWQQAAAQGISVFVSSGDNGAAGCDSSSASTATQGRGVNALCSSPYSTCVGGTQFNDVSNPSQYWSSTNGAGASSALSYIPEIAWNETGWTGGLWSTGGGASIVYSKPSWQSAPGVPSDGMRDVPDVAMTASIHDAYMTQISGSTYLLGGTSAATPSFASVMAMVLENAGAAQGNANPVFYGLATLQLSNGGAAVFHDTTSGSNTVPGVTGFNAGTGYDQATGLGSVDASVLVNHWQDSAGANYALSPSSSSVSVAQSATSTVTVSLSGMGGFNSSVALSASGAPAGVTLTLSSSTLTSTAPVTLTISASSSAAAGTSTLTISGSGGGLTRTAQIALTVSGPPSFRLTAGASSASVTAGSKSTVSLTTAGLNGFNAAVALSASGLPSGVTASFAPASLAAPGSGSSTLTLTAASTITTSGTSTVTVTAKSGSITKTQTLSLTVIVPSFTLTSSASSGSVTPVSPATITLTTALQNGFNAAVALSVSGMPKGVTASFAPTSIGAPGNGSSTLTLTAAANATAGNATLTVTAKGGAITKTQSINLTVPSFTLSAKSSSTSLILGGTASYTVTTAVQSGFSSAVALSVSGLPNGVTASFAPSSIASPGSGSSNLTLTAGSAVSPGTSSLTVTATGAGVTKTLSLGLTVPAPSFTLTLGAASASVAIGGSVPVSVSTSGVNAFAAAVTFSVSGLPKGVTASFSPTSIASPGAGSSSMTLAAGSTAVTGTSKLTVTATGGGVTKTQTLSLTVTH